MKEPCPACGLVEHDALKAGLAGVREIEDCNEDTYALIVHAQDYIVHLEAQVAEMVEGDR